ncbi:hypothetical protein WN48_08767 [Eufriesea mexicana]|nr:hypothetical protein WN48_08767 [Eufriesea mexicana]
MNKSFTGLYHREINTNIFFGVKFGKLLLDVLLAQERRNLIGPYFGSFQLTPFLSLRGTPLSFPLFPTNFHDKELLRIAVHRATEKRGSVKEKEISEDDGARETGKEKSLYHGERLGFENGNVEGAVKRGGRWKGAGVRASVTSPLAGFGHSQLRISPGADLRDNGDHSYGIAADIRKTSELQHSDRGSSAICSKARMQQCDLPSIGGEGARGCAGYIWGVSLIKRASLSPMAYGGGKWERSEGDQCLTLDKRPCRKDERHPDDHVVERSDANSLCDFGGNNNVERRGRKAWGLETSNKWIDVCGG